jgi:hypothetical protein
MKSSMIANRVGNWFFVSMAVIGLLSSCRVIINQALFPNRCERWDVVDLASGEVLWSKEGCAGDIANMKENATEAALEQYEATFGRKYEIRSTSWTREPEGVNQPRN